MRRAARVAGRIAAIALIIYLIALAAALLLRRDFIYPFDATPVRPQNAGLPRASVQHIPRPDQSLLTYWRVAPHPGKPMIVFFMGNIGNLAASGPRMRELALRGFGIAAMTYPGGGGIPGEPSETALKSDARLLWRSLTAEKPTQRRVIYGVSLGSGLATWLSANVDGETALVLETPFSRLCDAIENAAPLFPACPLMWDERYDSIDLVDQIGVPLLVLHGDADQIVPVELGQALFGKASAPKDMIIYPGGRHNDLRLYGAGVDMIDWINALPR